MPIGPPPPVPDPASAGRTLLYDGLAQNDVDMQFHRLLNLDTSNLPPIGIPPTIVCAPHNWINGWNAPSQTWSQAQPNFSDLSGYLTTGPTGQQQHITELGTIHIGHWQGSLIQNIYLPSLDLISTPAGPVNLNQFKLVNVGDPLNPQDAVNLRYMDNLLLGLNPKQAVQLATTRSVLFAGLQTIDGIQAQEGWRILVKNQTPRTQDNGIFIASAGIWVRSDDANAPAELNRAYCNVIQGTANGGTSWIQLNTITDFSSSPVDFELFSTSSGGGTTFTPGHGLQLVSGTLNVLGTTNRISVNGTVDIDAAYVGQTSITTLGTIGTGTWHAGIVGPTWGGTGNANVGVLTLSNVNLEVIMALTAVSPPLCKFQVTGNTLVTLPVSGTLTTWDGTETLTNKTINKRIQKIASNPKPSINTDQLDVFYITFLSSDITSMSDNMTGTPADGQELTIWIKDNNGLTAKNIVWGSRYTASSSLPLPMMTTAGMWLYTKFLYNTENLKWVLTNKLDNI